MTGIARSLFGVIGHISPLSHEYFLYYSRQPEADLRSPNIKVKVLKTPWLLWDHIALPGALREDKIDLFFSPYYKKPWWLPCKSIITVNDLNPLFNKHSFLYRLYFRCVLKRSLRTANLILVLSRYVKDQLLEIFEIDANKVMVHYCAVREDFSPLKDRLSARATLEKYGVTSNYILYVGNLMPHKNVSSLIKAYAGLPKDIKDAHSLVIGGSKKWCYRQLVRLAAQSGVKDKVVFTGFIPDEDLLSVYNGAALFVFPSLREGFGFPPLEAMACGVPVVASNVTSLPELIGDAGVLVDPYDVQALTRAMNDVLTNEELRKGLIEKGLKRVKQFSIEKTAAVIVEAFSKVADKREKPLARE